MPAKKIIAMFALAAQAQDAAGEVGERIFSDSLNGVEISDFLDTLTTGDYDSSYIYEEVVPNSSNEDFFSYDGTDGNSAGRPNESEDYDGKAFDSSQLFGNDPNTVNAGQHAGKDGTHNQCTKCHGLTFAECQAAASYETCNDAQDACITQIRSEMEGSNRVHKVYSGCSAKQACQAQSAKNFYGSGTEFKLRNQCRGHNINNARNYSPSKCTFCTKLGSSADKNTLVFGDATGVTSLYIDASTSTTWASILTDPYATLSTDIFTANDWYANNAGK